MTSDKKSQKFVRGIIKSQHPRNFLLIFLGLIFNKKIK